MLVVLVVSGVMPGPVVPVTLRAVMVVPVAPRGPPVLVLWVRRVWMARRGRVTVVWVALVVRAVTVPMVVPVVSVEPRTALPRRGRRVRWVPPLMVLPVVPAARAVPGLMPVV